MENMWFGFLKLFVDHSALLQYDLKNFFSRGEALNRLIVFAVRLAAGVVISFLLVKMFFPNAGLIHVAGLCMFLVGMAYVSEYFRRKKTQ
jgi:hypothetical protein